MPSNLVSAVRNLQQRKGRKRSGLAVAEGVRLVEEALSAGVAFRGALVSPVLGASPRGAGLLSDLATHAVPLEEIPDHALAQLADTDTPQGILAVIEPRRWTLADIRLDAGVPVLLLDGVQDPGNVGTLLRTAFALGAGGAILVKGTADPMNPKVLRAAAGATFRLPVAAVTEDEVGPWLVRERATLWATATEGAPIRRLTPPERLVIAVGNEGAGVGEGIRTLARERVAIPLSRGAESLNVAVAAGIILYEVARGR